MAFRAQLRGLRGSAQKVRLVADALRGRRVQEALAILELSPKRAARPLAKLLRSALANAEQRSDRGQVDVDALYVRAICVDGGPNNWRIRPRAQGRAYWIQKRSSHVTVELAER